MTRSDAERNRRLLLNAAAEALAENPGASIAQVAQAAGLARATVYRHFRTRQDLLEAMRAEALVSAAEAIADARLDEGDPIDALRRALQALASHGVRFRALLVEGAESDPVFLQERAEVLAPLHEVVRRGQEAGLIRTELPSRWVVTAIAALLAAGVRTLATGSDHQAVANLIFETLTGGVATTP
jgi:TetR/AcrR family transcriptional repressor of mexCD-oprJ operon